MLYRKSRDCRMTPIRAWPMRGQNCLREDFTMPKLPIWVSSTETLRRATGSIVQTAGHRVYDSEIEGRSRSAVGQLKIVQQYATNTGRLLDIGCASGLFLKCAVDAGWQAEGIEQSHTHCQTARRILDSNVQIHYSTLQGAHLPTASFDVVTLWDVLEHIPTQSGF